MELMPGAVELYLEDEVDAPDYEFLRFIEYNGLEYGP